MFKSNDERKMRYSIRKFSIGVASVVVASLFMGSVVHATEKEGNQVATSSKRANESQAEQGEQPKKLDLERDKAKEAVSEYVEKMVGAAYAKSSKDRHENTVALVNELQNIKNKYLNKIVESTPESQLSKLVMESRSQVDEAVSKFEKVSSSSSSSDSSTGDNKLSPTLPPQSKSDVSKPQVKSPVQKVFTTEAEKKKLQDLIRQGQEELKKLEDHLKEVNNYPELPDNDPDYKVQKKEFWDYSKTVAPEKMQAFKTLLENGSYTEQDLQRFIDDFIYYQIHAQIEKMTRQVALYRVKYPKITSLEQEFESGIKQTYKNNYGTLEGKALKTYFERDFLSAFNKIQKIVEELEKKSNQEVPQKQDKVAEAQKKVEEAEKKAKIQEEKDHRNYPTNTRKTIELEIAEAQVGVAKAELELAQAQAQTPQDTDRVNTAKAKVETAKREVEKLEKIKSGHGRPQAGAQKPTPEIPEVKPVPQPAPPKTSKIFTASDGKTKVTVVFDKAVDADKVNIKEVTTKELADKIARKTGGGTVRVFDLSLSKGGKETHVNGERTVRLALGQTGSDVHVYHVKENGDLERIPSKVENGQVVFKTSHFSLFAIKTLSKNQNVTTPKQTKPSIQDSQTQIGENQTGKFQNKEVNPKPLATGNKTMAKGNSTSATEKKLPSTGVASNLVLEFIGLLGLAGTSLIAMKRRK